MNKLIELMVNIKKVLYGTFKVTSILYLICVCLLGVIGAVMSILIRIEFISSFLETALGFLSHLFVIVIFRCG